MILGSKTGSAVCSGSTLALDELSGLQVWFIIAGSRK